MYKIVQESLNEGVYFDGNNFIFDFNDDNVHHFINLRYDNRFIKKYKNDIFYSYIIKEHTPKDIKQLFIKSLKFKDEKFISLEQYNNFLNKGIQGLLHTIDNNIDIIIYPKSSSPINFDIANKIKNKLGNNTHIAKDVIIKNEIENIKIDLSKISDKTAKNLLKHSSKNNEFFLKKIPPQYRKYFSNFLKFDNDVQRTLYNKISGNVLVIDDILAKGTTINEIIKLIESFNPKTLIKYVLLKT